MTRWYFAASFTLLAVFAVAQVNFYTQDRWLALIDYTGISYEKVKAAAPHFPKSAHIESEKQYADFKGKLAQWKTKYASEVEAFLALPEVKKVNPSRVHLGLQQAVETRKFENSYWQWIQAAGLSMQDVHGFASHFPQPRITSDLDKSEQVYNAVLHDWMKLYPKELEAMLNHPTLVSMNKSHEPAAIEVPVAEPFTLIEVSETLPLFADYDSGNSELDKQRYELAVKHWYFKYKPDEYVTRYNVTDYHKNIEQKQ
ncbi:MAG: hypothetical protein KF872_00050 [Chitinophagales bacterium]|nr:hypothetical protein [Chitinophagales bacterium]